MGIRKYIGYELDLEFSGRRNLKSFNYLDTTKELWDSVEAAYAQKRNNARVLELKKEIAAFKQGSLSIGDYYSKFRALWKELELYMSLELCCAKKERKLLEDQHIFELPGGVNPEFQTVCAHVTRQDPLPPMGTIFTLL